MSERLASSASGRSVQILGSYADYDGVEMGFDNPDIDVWGLNLAYKRAPFAEYSFDRWFEMHTPDWQAENWPGHFDELSHADCPEVMMTESRRDLTPHSVRYPLAAVDGLIGRHAYHASTHDFQIGLAILMGYDRIELHAIQAGENSGEPLAARACMEFWLGYAIATGVDVKLCGGTPNLFRNVGFYTTRRPYGYEFQQRYHGTVILPE